MLDNYELKGKKFEIGIEDSGYPELLKDVENPPKRIYGIGDPEALEPSVAIMGPRLISDYCKDLTIRFSEQISESGLGLICGGARGCGQTALDEAIDSGGRAVVVFGSGADVIYPNNNPNLFQRTIDSGGAIISEQRWETPPVPPSFTARNRIIAGLSMMVYIPNAALPSGTFSAAEIANNIGREVCVCPGDINSPLSKGTNMLLAQGMATPIIDGSTFDGACGRAVEKYRDLLSVETLRNWDKRFSIDWDKYRDDTKDVLENSARGVERRSEKHSPARNQER